MILYHPLNKKDSANRKAIEKYALRQVYVFHGKFRLWLTNNPSAQWQEKEKRKAITFKEALKLTKTYAEESKIEYHFISESLGETKPTIKDFEGDAEGIYNCVDLEFEALKQPGSKTSII